MQYGKYKEDVYNYNYKGKLWQKIFINFTAIFFLLPSSAGKTSWNTLSSPDNPQTECLHRLQVATFAHMDVDLILSKATGGI